MSEDGLCLLCDMQPGVVAFAGSAICLSCAASRAEQSRLLGQASCGAALDLGRLEAELDGARALNLERLRELIRSASDPAVAAIAAHVQTLERMCD